MKTQNIASAALALGISIFALVGTAAEDVFNVFYEGALEQTVSNVKFETPDGPCELTLGRAPSEVGSIKLGRTRLNLPKGMFGMSPVVRMMDDGRICLAYVSPQHHDDKVCAFRMLAWIGPWESLKAGSLRGFYTVEYGRPNGEDLWLPKDLTWGDAKYRAFVEKQAKGDGLVTVDLTTDLSRFATIHESEYYDAHASSIMLPDEKTMFCFWDLAHGGPCGPAAKSTDGGRTWTDISEKIPAELRESNDAPVAFRFVDPKTGKARLRVFAGYRSLDGKGARGPADRLLAEAMPSVMSEDDGETWKYVPPMGADFRCVISFFGMERLKDGSYFGVFQRGPQPNGKGSPLEVLGTYSRDGGLTWEKPHLIACDERYDLCEPAVFYSPDKSELCCLIRENKGKGPSQMCFSQDEGKTWTKNEPAPLALWGHRHVVQKLHDGRYLVVFRDTKDFIGSTVVAWVGPYASIKDGTGKGGYRIRLFPNYGTAYDCGYQGMHLKKDGEIVINTYSKFRPWANATPSIVSLHFKIEEADALLAKAAAGKKAYWASQLAALDEAKKGVKPAKEVFEGQVDRQRMWIPFDDEVKAKKVTLLTKATVYGFVRRDKSNSFRQMEALTPMPVTRSNGAFDLQQILGFKLNLRSWYEDPLTAYVKWEVESEKAGKRVVRILNDYYGTVFVNGEQLPSTYGPDGSRGMRPFYGNIQAGLRLEVNLKQGKNEIVLMTSPGSAGQWLCAAALEN